VPVALVKPAADPVVAAARRPWLAHYPPGVPAEVEVDPRTTLVDVLEQSQAAQVDRVPRQPAQDQRRQDPAPRTAALSARVRRLTGINAEAVLRCEHAPTRSDDR
jgi:hypothetical protein